ncbi:MAG: DUF433 domain-containing protein [Candidatus Aureabacteria bacterium]|nr:DUF433 domain-containing protein [Candidatus Auribacterota bacterium]
MSDKLFTDPKTKPVYYLSEAAHYLRVNKITLRSWVYGQPSKTKGHKKLTSPLIEPAGKQGPEKLSFLNLIEAHILFALRQTHKVKMSVIRNAIDYLKKNRNTQHPLLEKDIMTDGYHLFIKELEKYISISEDGQIVIKDIMEKYIQRIEWDKQGVPVLFYPYTRKPSSSVDCPKNIVMDPTIAFGRPVVSGTRITTAFIFERYSAGDSIHDIVKDYGLKTQDVEEALRNETQRTAA